MTAKSATVTAASPSAPWAPGIVSTGIALVLAFLALQTGLAARLEAVLFDRETAFVRWVDPVAADGVVVVGVDQATVDAIAAPIALWHAQFGATLSAIGRARPKLVVLDVVLPEHSMDAFGTGLDLALLRGIATARMASPSGGIVVALQPDAAGRLRAPYLPFIAAAGDNGAGAAVYRIEIDGAVRYVDSELSTFMAAVARHLGVTAHSGYIDYSRGAPFDYVPMIEVLRRAQATDAGWLAQQFAGKVVVIGSVLPFLDRRRQPAPMAAWEPSFVEPPAVLIHAQAVRSLLSHGFIPEVPRAVAWALTITFALTGLLAAAIPRWLILVAALAASFVAAAWGLRLGGYVPLAAAWIAGGSAVVIRSGYDGWHFLRERNRLARLFAGYVSPQVFRGIVAGRLAGRGRGRLAMLFADVRGFTTMTEHSAVDEVVDVLNRYYGAFTPILHRHGATIDGFRGDGLNALFGAPEPNADAPGAALRAAREMLMALAALNESLQLEGHSPLQIGIGLAYGEAAFGDVGSLDRRDFTAIGDPVNLAARLQDLTKQLNCAVLMTEAMYDGLSASDRQDLLDFGVQPIKGHSAIRVWGCRRLHADGRPSEAAPGRVASSHGQGDRPALLAGAVRRQEG